MNLAHGHVLTPNRIFGEAELGKVLTTQFLFLFMTEKKFIKLWWCHRRSCEHGMNLPAVVNLMLEQMEENAIDAFELRPTIANQGHTCGKSSSAEFVTKVDQPAIHGTLRAVKTGNCREWNFWSEGRSPNAGTLKRTDIEPIDGIIMVERVDYRREKTGSLGVKLRWRKLGTSLEQAMIGPSVVVGLGMKIGQGAHENLLTPKSHRQHE